MFINQGQKLEIKGKFFSLSLTANKNQQFSQESLSQYQSFVDKVDAFFEHMKKEHIIDLLHKNKPHKKIIRLFDKVSSAPLEHISFEANGILAQMEGIKLGFKTLKDFNAGAYRDIRRNLIKNSNSNSYYGFIFELTVASLLASNGIQFDVCSTRDGSPDFVLPINGNTYHIECRSVFSNAPEGSEEKYRLKVNQGINSKEKKKYAALNCALLIDTTPIERLRNTGVILTNKEVIPKESKFGCIGLFTNYTRTAHGTVILTHGWSRNYFNGINPDFKNILDSFIPFNPDDEEVHMVDAFTDI
ncbi:hypothetical protein OLEAN_C23810 [Oleispira antarctica RB-8]|uniref:Uncharacterized protein n=1 Tax=Oleispira antarctica RB-8 TaxID=698738 RepID=R4YNM2_OLEAN|nr:hypothetical protein OLEAN_C23810 [Oleispira antarctica RB-8]